MPAVTDRARLRYVVFIVLALLINLIDTTLTRSAQDPRRQLILAIASSFDVIVVASALYYWLLVRQRIRTRSSMITIALLATLRASFLFPDGARAKTVITAICELGFIGALAIYVGRTRKNALEKGADPAAVIRTLVGRMVPLPVAINALTAELVILFYAFFSWGAKPHIAPDTQPFTNYKRAGQAELLGVLPFACIFEIIPAHLVLRQWNSTIAWAATGLSVYTMIWMVGLARSFRLRPTLVADDFLYLRHGLVFQLRVPRSLIAAIHRAEASDAQSAVPSRTEPSHCIEFTRELTAEGLFGFQKRLTRVALTLDDPLAFEQALGLSFE